MFGLIVIVIAVAYLLLSIAIVKSVRTHARNTGKNVARWGWGAALLMFLIPGWDWLPTVAVHQYYCATEAGFWVYKTPEQWRLENPGVMEGLVANERDTSVIHVGGDDNWTNTYHLNQRIDLRTRHQGPLPLYRWQLESELVDSKTGERLVRAADFYTSYSREGGGWHGWKFWLANSHCPDHSVNASQFGKYRTQFKGARQ